MNSSVISKPLSAIELTEAGLAAIDKWNPSTKAMFSVTPDAALESASSIDKRLSDGEWCGLLAGMTMSLKDNIAMAGMVTTAGSKILANNMSNRDAFIVERLKRAGAIIMGKANLHEWVFGPTSQSTHDMKVFENCAIMQHGQVAATFATKQTSARERGTR